MKQLTDVGEVVGLYEDRSIFAWLEFEDGQRYHYDRIERDLAKVKPDEIYLPPGLVYKRDPRSESSGKAKIETV